MNLLEKLAIAKRAIESITQHDDAPLADVKLIIADLRTFVGDELDKAVPRRAEKARKAAEEAKKKADAETRKGQPELPPQFHSMPPDVEKGETETKLTESPPGV